MNVTTETTVDLVALICIYISVYLINKVRRDFNNLIMRLMWHAWLLLAVYFTSATASYLFLNKILFMASYFINLAFFYLIIIVYEIMNYDRIRPAPMILYSLLSGYYLNILLRFDYVHFYYFTNGDISLIGVGEIRLILPLVAIIPATIFLYSTYRIYLKSQGELRKQALINLIGAMLFTIGPIAIYVFQLYNYLPGVDILLPSVGLLVVSISIYHAPQLMYLLSFDLYHITVIQSETGLVQYHHSWNSDFKLDQNSQSMFTSMLEALSGFSDSMLRVGKLLNLELERGELIISYSEDHKFYFALFASKSTRILRDSMKRFEREFISAFPCCDDNYIIDMDREIGDRIMKEAFNYTLNNQ